MNMGNKIHSLLRVDGVLVSGLGRGSEFLAIDWVRNQIKDKTAIDPFPGTLNVRITKDAWESLFARRHAFLRIADPETNSCPGYLRKVVLRSQLGTTQTAYVILPEMTIYSDVLEIISGERLRDRLGLVDGDSVHVEELPDG